MIMLSSTLQFTLLGWVAQGLAAPTVRDFASYTAQPSRAAAVQEAFDRAWNAYYTYAFPHDSLTPLSRSFEDDLYVCVASWDTILLIPITAAVGAQVL